jgi:hypothetical protein
VVEPAGFRVAHVAATITVLVALNRVRFTRAVVRVVGDTVPVLIHRGRVNSRIWSSWLRVARCGNGPRVPRGPVACVRRMRRCVNHGPPTSISRRRIDRPAVGWCAAIGLVFLFAGGIAAGHSDSRQQDDGANGATHPGSGTP